MRDLRFSVLAVLLLISLYLVVTPMIFKTSGVVVTFVAEDANCANVKEGDIVSSVKGMDIKNSDDFKNALQNVVVDEYVNMIVGGAPAGCVVVRENYIGVAVKDADSGNLRFGIDIEGGTRVILKPKQNATAQTIEETISTLNTRINIYGLREMTARAVGQELIQIEMAGATGNEIKDFLAKQGKFEAKILESLDVMNGSSKIIVDGKTYPVDVVGEKFSVNGSAYGANESFYLDGIKFDVENVTEKNVVVFANAFAGKDVVTVYTDPQSSVIRKSLSGNGYEFSFSVLISKEGAERFAKVTKNLPTRFTGAGSYLAYPLVLFLDEKEMSQLNIAADLAGKALTTPSITGTRESKESALTERSRLQTILRSGGLPVELEILKADVISPVAGGELLKSIVYVMLASAMAVSGVIFVRYRKIKIAAPMILISLSEVVLILGFAALTQTLTGGKGWVLDIPAIAGIIAIVGTGVNQLIIITDQMLLEKTLTVKYRYKTAMSIIMTSAAIVFAAMIPLWVMGLGQLKGFAITTLIGVFFGIVITRPAYASILERVEKL